MKPKDYDAIITFIHQHSSKCSRKILSDTVSNFRGKFPYNTLVSVFLNDLQRKVKRTYHAKSHENDCERYYKIYRQRIEKSKKRMEKCKNEAGIAKIENSAVRSTNPKMKASSTPIRPEDQKCKDIDALSRSEHEHPNGPIANPSARAKGRSAVKDALTTCNTQQDNAKPDYEAPSTLKCYSSRKALNCDADGCPRSSTTNPPVRAECVSVAKAALSPGKEHQGGVKTDCKATLVSEPVLIGLANDFDLPPFLMARLVVERYVIHQRETLKQSSGSAAGNVEKRQVSETSRSNTNDLIENLEKRMTGVGLKHDAATVKVRTVSDVAPEVTTETRRISLCGNELNSQRHGQDQTSDTLRAELTKDGAKAFPTGSQSSPASGVVTSSTAGHQQSQPSGTSGKENSASLVPRRAGFSTVEVTERPHQSSSQHMDAICFTTSEPGQAWSKAASTGTPGKQKSADQSPVPRRVGFSTVDNAGSPLQPSTKCTDRVFVGTQEPGRPQSKATDIGKAEEQINTAPSPVPRRAAFSTLATPGHTDKLCLGTSEPGQPWGKATDFGKSAELMNTAVSPMPRRVAFSTADNLGNETDCAELMDGGTPTKQTGKLVSGTNESVFNANNNASGRNMAAGNGFETPGHISPDTHMQQEDLQTPTVDANVSNINNAVRDHTTTGDASSNNDVSKKSAATVAIFDAKTSVKNQVSLLMKNLHQIPDANLREQVLQCASYDVCFGPINDAIRHAIGLEYEVKLVQCVKEQNLPFLDENDLRKRGYDKTPDIKLEVPIAVNGHPVCWIESKASFGDHETHGQYLDAQYYSYWNRFGPGLVIYWFGFIDEIFEEMQKQGILIMDSFPAKDAITFMCP